MRLMRSEARNAGSRDTQAAVVHDPLRITKQRGSGLAFDLGYESFALRTGNGLQESVAEHFDPVAEATLAIGPQGEGNEQCRLRRVLVH